MFVLLLFIMALALASVAGAFSIFGLVSIYPSVAIGVIVGGIVIEVCKLATISYFYQFSAVMSYIQKMFAVIFIFISMSITSMGVYGYLTKGYMLQQNPIQDVEMTVQNIDNEILTLEEKISNNNVQIKILNEAMNRYIELGAVTKGMDKIMGEDDIKYKRLHDSNDEYRNSISELRVERNKQLSLLNGLEAEVGTIKYIAGLFGGEGKSSIEKALQYFSFLMVLSIDPFAVSLLVFANTAYRHRNDKRVRGEFEFLKQEKVELPLTPEEMKEKLEALIEADIESEQDFQEEMDSTVKNIEEVKNVSMAERLRKRVDSWSTKRK